MDSVSKVPYEFIVGDSREVLKKYPEAFVDLTVTSPPYNVGKEYDSHVDFMDDTEYFSLIEEVFKEVYRITKVGGRLALNIPFIGNYASKPKNKKLIFYPNFFMTVLEKVGWEPRDFVVWVKSHNEDNISVLNSTAWGSWKSPSCPYLRCFGEPILIFHKRDKKLQHAGETDLTRDEFLLFTKNIWFFPPEFNRDHPAIFPEELPRRLIKLYTWIGGTVLDPFCGTGTTNVAAYKLKRKSVGIDISEEYINLAKKRIEGVIREERISKIDMFL